MEKPDKTEEEISIEDELSNEPEFQEAVRNATSGQYEHTLFEIWEDMLTRSIEGTKGHLTIPVADSILRHWPWLGYNDIDPYLSARREYLTQALETLRSCYPDNQEVEDLFAENVDDFKLHKDTYIEVIFEWTIMTNQWAKGWADTPLDDPSKPYLHAVIADVTGMIVGPEGYIPQLQNLAHFEITEDEGKELSARVEAAMTEDETDE